MQIRTRSGTCRTFCSGIDFFQWSRGSGDSGGATRDRGGRCSSSRRGTGASIEQSDGGRSSSSRTSGCRCCRGVIFTDRVLVRTRASKAADCSCRQSRRCDSD